jgi:hypothetical protein
MERKEQIDKGLGDSQAKYSKDAVAEMWLALNPNGRMAR